MEKIPTTHINRQMWIDALRSGEFKQAHEMMASENGEGFCCLGVAARIAGVPMTVLTGALQSRFAGINSNRLYSELHLTDTQCDKLAIKNDTHGWDFNDIAEWIQSDFSDEVEKMIEARVLGVDAAEEEQTNGEIK